MDALLSQNDPCSVTPRIIRLGEERHHVRTPSDALDLEYIFIKVPLNLLYVLPVFLLQQESK
jgi:hypothetical protein